MRSVSTTTTSKQTIRAALAALPLMALLVTASVMAVASSAHAEDMDTRMKRLERDVQTLSQAVYKGKIPPASAQASSAGSSEYQANVETRLSDIESQIRDLTGQVERQTYETQQLKTQLDRALADVNLRLTGIEKSGAATAQQSQNSGRLCCAEHAAKRHVKSR